MAFTNDFTKAPLQIILDQLNNDNSSTFTDAMVTAGAPSVVSIAGRDTQLTLTSVAGSGYSGSVDVTYNRVGLASVPGARSTQFMLGANTHLSDIISQINTAYGINLTAADYVDAALPTFTGTAPHQTQTIDLVAAAGSLVFTGTLTLTIDANDVPLSSAVTTTSLNGLVYTQPA